MLARRVRDSVRYRARVAAAAVLPEFVVIATTVMCAHRATVGVFPNFLHPRTFNEKVLHRMLFDRRPILTRVQDKYAVRTYVKERIGEHILARLYWATRNPSDIPFAELPDRFVVKPTHASGWYRIVSDRTALDPRELVETCRGWLARNYYDEQREWVYKHIEPRILVEEYVDDGLGLHPIRYKFYVFHGCARIVEVCVGVPEEASIGFYDRAWSKLSVRLADWREIGGTIARPARLGEMLECAETLARGLDFVRVDLYSSATRVYFGEMTTTPGGGIYVFAPREFGRTLGAYWELSSRR